MKIQVNCKNCNISFLKCQHQIKKTKNNFCSRSCSATFNNKGKQKNPPKEYECIRCSCKYFFKRGKSTRKLCEECYMETPYKKNELYKTLTIQDYINRSSVKDKHPSWIHVHVRGFARSWNSELIGSKCENCGYDKHIEFCHIKPISEFDKTTKLEVVNSRENILILCRNCHWEFDNGLLPLDQIPSD